MGAILTDVKKHIGGISEDNTDFDSDILMFVNGAFSKITRVGGGPEIGFRVSESTAWEDFTTDPRLLSAVENYVTADVKLSFDSSTLPSFVITSLEKQRDEYLWTINNYADYWPASGGT